jgi:ATP-dependent Clp protease adapter protein ClpS
MPDSLYHLVLLDDSHHTFAYVIDMLKADFCFSEEKAIEHAMEVHMNGRTVVMTSEKAQAELARDRIQTYGADRGCLSQKAPCARSLSRLLRLPLCAPSLLV